jgi:hypothetical protein
MRCFWICLVLLSSGVAAQTGGPPLDTSGLMLESHGAVVGYGLDAALDPGPAAPCCEAIASSASGSMAFGLGPGAGAGYGVSQVVALVGGADASYVFSDYFGDAGSFDQPARAVTLDLGVRLHVLPQPDYVPYAEVLASRFYLLDDAGGFRGTGFTLGAGFLSTMSDRLALRAGVRGTFGGYDTVIIGDEAEDIGFDLDAINVRGHVGVVYFPLR